MGVDIFSLFCFEEKRAMFRNIVVKQLLIKKQLPLEKDAKGEVLLEENKKKINIEKDFDTNMKMEIKNKDTNKLKMKEERGIDKDEKPSTCLKAEVIDSEMKDDKTIGK